MALYFTTILHNIGYEDGPIQNRQYYPEVQECLLLDLIAQGKWAGFQSSIRQIAAFGAIALSICMFDHASISLLAQTTANRQMATVQFHVVDRDGEPQPYRLVSFTQTSSLTEFRYHDTESGTRHTLYFRIPEE